ncbi:aconitase A [Candidatus Kuenenia stuttgartiensis]|uniref:Aconitase A n=1 Tax=Kuenenia stuttgartiensis TaxID=174633 RepID=A0A6G7GT94_KUEST|nr:aconitase A [Candidatus Kuenenia stuttgartiensis]
MGTVVGGCVGKVGSVGGCSAVTGTSAWSQFDRGANADSSAFGFAGSLVDIGI